MHSTLHSVHRCKLSYPVFLSSTLSKHITTCSRPTQLRQLFKYSSVIYCHCYTAEVNGVVQLWLSHSVCPRLSQVIVAFCFFKYMTHWQTRRQDCDLCHSDHSSNLSTVLCHPRHALFQFLSRSAMLEPDIGAGGACVCPSVRLTPSYPTGCFKKVAPLKLFWNIFTSVKSFCVKFCKFVGNSYPHISTDFCRFILIFHRIALIFPRVPIVFTLSSSE